MNVIQSSLATRRRCLSGDQVSRKVNGAVALRAQAASVCVHSKLTGRSKIQDWNPEVRFAENEGVNSPLQTIEIRLKYNRNETAKAFHGFVSVFVSAGFI